MSDVNMALKFAGEVYALSLPSMALQIFGEYLVPRLPEAEPNPR